MQSLSPPHALMPAFLLGGGLAASLAIGHPALALLLGMVLNLVFQPELPAATKAGSKWLLQGAIVLLGLTLSASTLWTVSQDYAGLIVLYVAGALTAGLLLGRLLRTDTDQARLLASGTAICGGTAIATLAPVIRARAESVAVCLGIVFLLNALAILVLPPLGEWLALSQEQFGVWVALAVHDTSSVIGTAAIYGDEALAVATTVKLARTLWLIPLMLAAGLLMRRQEARLRLPGFVLLFVAASVLGSLIGFAPALVAGIKALSQTMLIAALFLIGLEINRATLAAVNGRAVWLAITLWALVVPLTLVAVKQWA
ncbi:MAG: putative sulfate exporter family transporter [Pseudomonadota bacterium]